MLANLCLKKTNICSANKCWGIRHADHMSLLNWQDLVNICLRESVREACSRLAGLGLLWTAMFVIYILDTYMIETCLCAYLLFTVATGILWNHLNWINPKYMHNSDISYWLVHVTKLRQSAWVCIFASIKHSYLLMSSNKH